jgi:CubicO group peptidase (beta-lactamase class C family)
VTLNDFFHIGSCGKSVLAVMAGKLVEQGTMRWEERVLDRLPEYRELANPAYGDVTLEDLFLCRGGIAAYTSDDEVLPDISPRSVDPRLDFARYLLSRPPSAPRLQDGRFRHLYSNASYTVAACMIERAADAPWEELVAQTLSRELGYAVHIGWPNTLNAQYQPWGHGWWEEQATGNKEQDESRSRATSRSGESSVANASVNSGLKPGATDQGASPLRVYGPEDPYALSILLAPAGDLSMKPLDYAKYVQWHLQGLRGHDGYLKSETMRYIHYGHKGFSIGVGNGRYHGQEVSQFDGSAGTFYCHSIVVPEGDYAYVLLANAGHAEAVKGIYELSGELMRRRFGKRPWWRVWG